VTTSLPEASGRLLEDRYRLLDRLGGGAVADVFRGIDERLERAVAVKLFRGDAAQELQRHDAEMRTLAVLDHPSLVTVFDAGTDDETGQPFLVMQLVEGCTLADELLDGALDPERSARYGAALADALGYVHERGLVHRDVKPANVLISDDGRVHLADFGIARLVGSMHVTRTGDVLGTPAYFAPEQVAGEPVGPPTDMYALGILLIECLSGRRPFEGTAMEVAMARLNRAPEVPAGLTEDWHTLLTAMTQRNPAERPSAPAVATGLRQIAQGMSMDSTVAMPAPARGPATTVMPATSVYSPATSVAQATPPPAAAAASARRVDGRTWVIGAIVVLLLAGIGVGIYAATHHSSSSGGARVHVGPQIKNSRLESDMRKIENLIH
jgi:serine/threonine protein kinase